LIVIFGEIIPQATFSRYAMAVGYKTVWLVKILIFVLYPICLPLSWILDRMLGEEMPDIYSKKELMKIVEQHEDLKDSTIDADEERIIRGALSYSDETAIDVMTPRTMLYALAGELKINNSLLKKIKESGFTRIPIYDEVIDDIIGVLYVKDLLGVKKGTRLNKICHHESLMIIKGDIKLDALLNKFIRHKEHIALVKDEFGGTAGIVTLEDIVEEVLRVEIVDETDRVANLQKEARKNIGN